MACNYLMARYTFISSWLDPIKDSNQAVVLTARGFLFIFRSILWPNQGETFLHHVFN